MSIEFLTSMSDVGYSEEEGTFGSIIPVRQLPKAENYANDPKVKRWAESELRELVEWVRNDRLVLHQEWEEVRNMALLKHDHDKRYFGRSNSYLPLYARNKQTLVSGLTRGLFPSDDYIDVTLRETAPSQNPAAIKNREGLLEAIKMYMKWEFEVVGRVRSALKPGLGQLIDYGTSPFKVEYKKELKRKGVLELASGLTGGTEAKFRKFRQEGLQVKACNLFDWYVYPATISDFEEATLVFEDVSVPRAYIDLMRRTGKWNDEQCQAALHGEKNAAQRASEANLLSTRAGMSELGAEIDGATAFRIPLTECWTFCDVLPSSALLDEEERGQLIPVRVVLAADGSVVEVCRNPRFHQRPPYGVARMNTEPNFFYGFGHGKMTRPMQLLANDFANQTNDVGQYGLNPITVINPSIMLGKPPPLSPGATFYANDIQQAMSFLRPDIEQLQYGLQLLNMYIGMGQDFGGAPPVMQGSKGAKTATASQILQKNAQGPVQDVVEEFELDVMTPILQMAFSNAQQFRKEEVMASVAGVSFKIDEQQLATDAELRWMASSQSANSQQRAQQAMSLMQAVSSLIEPLMMQGYVVDFAPLVQKVYTEGFGFRDFQSFIKKAQAVPNGPPQPGQMPGVVQQQGDSVRSALEQLTGAGGVEMAPGEGEEFANVRDDVEAQTAMMGGMPGEGEL